VGSNLDLQESVFEKGVKLKVAKIGRNVYLHKAKFKDSIDMTGIDVTGSLIFDGGQFSEVILSMSKGGTIDFKGTDINILDLTGTQVNKVLIKSTETVKWPNKLILHGFTYNQFSLIGSEGVLIQNVDLYKNWLKKGRYSPQPYEQAATVLRQSGEPELANSMLYAGKERERDEAWAEHDIGKWFLFTGLKYTIGYGLGTRYFRALWWSLGFILLGTLVCLSARKHENLSELVVSVAKTDQNGKTPNYWVCAFYSLDMLLPLIRLWGKHERIDMPPWQCYYFYIHKMFGWVLATFIVAGLSGLTQG